VVVELSQFSAPIERVRLWRDPALAGIGLLSVVHHGVCALTASEEVALRALVDSVR
jgi:hypothetical protein